MAAEEFSMRIEQTVQVTSFCHQRVAIGLSGLSPDITDEQILALMSGPVDRTYKHLSKAVRDKCDDMRSREISEMRDAISKPEKP